MSTWCVYDFISDVMAVLSLFHHHHGQYIKNSRFWAHNPLRCTIAYVGWQVSQFLLSFPSLTRWGMIAGGAFQPISSQTPLAGLVWEYINEHFWIKKKSCNTKIKKIYESFVPSFEQVWYEHFPTWVYIKAYHITSQIVSQMWVPSPVTNKVCKILG
jgi:hypothetical protein